MRRMIATATAQVQAVRLAPASSRPSVRLAKMPTLPMGFITEKSAATKLASAASVIMMIARPLLRSVVLRTPGTPYPDVMRVPRLSDAVMQFFGEDERCRRVPVLSSMGTWCCASIAEAQLLLSPALRVRVDQIAALDGCAWLRTSKTAQLVCSDSNTDILCTPMSST